MAVLLLSDWIPWGCCPICGPLLTRGLYTACDCEFVVLNSIALKRTFSFREIKSWGDLLKLATGENKSLLTWEIQPSRSFNRSSSCGTAVPFWKIPPEGCRDGSWGHLLLSTSSSGDQCPLLTSVGPACMWVHRHMFRPDTHTHKIKKKIKRLGRSGAWFLSFVPGCRCSLSGGEPALPW